jgi:hypothetical protein
MQAEILVRVYRIALPHDKPFEWPLAIANAKLPAPGVAEILESADRYFCKRSIIQAFAP